MTESRYLEKRKKLSLGAFPLALAVGTVAVLSLADAKQTDNSQSLERDSVALQTPHEFDDQAKNILKKSAERYKSVQSWTVEQEVVNAGRFTKKVKAEYQAPQKLRVSTREAKGIKTVAYYNDGKVVTLRDFDNVVEYQESPLERHSKPRAVGATENARQPFGNALGQYLSGFFIGEENIFGQPVQTVKYAGEATVNGVPVENITVTAQRRNQPVTITYSIGKQDSLLHQVVQKATNADGTSADYVETYSNQKTDVPLDDSIFEFTPPGGAEKVDRFTRSRGVQATPGQKPFAITGKDIDGKAISLAQYKGKVVLLDFWATWCAPCRAELPNLKTAYAKYKPQGFDVLGVSLDTSAAPLKTFVAKQRIGWRNTYDGYWNGKIANAYNVRFIPTTILIGRDGKVAAINPHGETLESAIEAELLKK